MAEVDVERIYKQYAKPVQHYLLGLCRNSQVAEELTAETFYQVVKSIDRFNGTCKLQTWIFQIAKHIYYQYLEKSKKYSVPLEDVKQLEGSAISIEEHTESKEIRIDLYKKIQALESPARDVIYLRLSGELSFSEIGEIMGQTENWARVTYYRGKERMKSL